MKVAVYDTTLRDGTQMLGVNFSVEDKIKIAKKLDELGIDYIEGGWPSSNPKDMEFFKKIKQVGLKNSKIATFGSTRYYKNSVESDHNLNAIIEVQPDAASIFGKAWDIHVHESLGISLEENLKLIKESVEYLKKSIKEVFFIAEHFFDGYKKNSAYALKVLDTAGQAGADIVVLADTNGGTQFFEMNSIINKIKEKFSFPLGIHCHNDNGMATANTIEAVRQGIVQIQGTINGYGERCGNANLCEIIPNLELKSNYKILGKNIDKLTGVSKFISEIANKHPSANMPYVGTNAFAHKGGVHVSAVMKLPQTYEHIIPEKVGNKRRVSISDLSGKSNVLYKIKEFGLNLDLDKDKVSNIIKEVKKKVNKGYEYEGAEASFELLIQKTVNKGFKYLEPLSYRVISEDYKEGGSIAEATVKVKVKNEIFYTVGEGNGPVNALGRALRKALITVYPETTHVILDDYKVRILNSEATGSLVRVLVEGRDNRNGNLSSTVGVSTNVIKASWEALLDMYEYFIYKNISSSRPNQ